MGFVDSLHFGKWEILVNILVELSRSDVIGAITTDDMGRILYCLGAGKHGLPFEQPTWRLGELVPIYHSGSELEFAVIASRQVIVGV